jgi:hypothetical protein
MADKEQYEIYKGLFAWEEDRAKSLSESGKIYLSILTIAIALIGYKVGETHISAVAKVQHGGFPTGFAAYVLSLGAFVFGLVMTLMSLRMHKYEQITDPEEFFLQSVDENWTKEVFFDKLIAKMVVATNVNSDTNDRRAGNLAWASYSLLIGVALYGVVILLFTSM